MANRKIKESLGKTKFSTTLKNISGDKVIATADTIADLNYNATLADGTVTEGAYQSEVNKLHADAIEELKNSKANVSFNPKDIAYDETMKVFELADNIDTSNYSTIILRGLLDEKGEETDVLDCSPITVENCTYIVKRTFTLNQDLVLPKNSCLCFEGGYIKSEEKHWITGVFEPSSIGISGSRYQSLFKIQNNTAFPIINENVFIDTPYNCKFNRSWFISDGAFFSNAEAVIQLQRDFLIIGIYLYLDINQYLYPTYLDRALNFNPSKDEYQKELFYIAISSPELVYNVIAGYFSFSPYERDDEGYEHYHTINLLLNNVAFLNFYDTETLVTSAYLGNSQYQGATRFNSILGSNSTVILQDNTILSEHYIKLSGNNILLKSKYNVMMSNCLNCRISAPIIGTESTVFNYNTCKGDFQPGDPCVISHCVFDTLDTATYYSDEAEEKGIYFCNCTLNNTTLDSYNRFKVIE